MDARTGRLYHELPDKYLDNPLAGEGPASAGGLVSSALNLRLAHNIIPGQDFFQFSWHEVRYKIEPSAQ